MAQFRKIAIKYLKTFLKKREREREETEDDRSAH